MRAMTRAEIRYIVLAIAATRKRFNASQTAQDRTVEHERLSVLYRCLPAEQLAHLLEEPDSFKAWQLEELLDN